MTQPRYVSIVFTCFLLFGFIGVALAQTQPPASPAPARTNRPAVRITRSSTNGP